MWPLAMSPTWWPIPAPSQHINRGGGGEGAEKGRGRPHSVAPFVHMSRTEWEGGCAALTLRPCPSVHKRGQGSLPVQVSRGHTFCMPPCIPCLHAETG
jgi:hypothetical protein